MQGSHPSVPHISAADPIVILSYARTPMGGMQGVFADVSAVDLGATAIKAAVERAGVDGADVERVYMGNVLPAGLGQAPARQAALKAGLPLSAEATTVNKVCGSGMQTVIMAAEGLAAGSIDLAVAGGMESMTNAPYMLKKHRAGARFGHDTAFDHMLLDGLEDAYEGGSMGSFAQVTANEYQLTREDMDNYAIESLRRAQAAIADGPAPAKWWSIPTNSRPRAAPTRSRACAPPSPRTARSLRHHRRRSPTAPQPWCSPAQAWPRPRG